jgi:5-methylcytosine-specific restriction endonuclease McrA
MTTYFVNSDAVSNAGVSLHYEWVRRGIAVTGGEARFRAALARIRKGDTVLIYANRTGLVARGVAEDDEVIDAIGEQVVNPAEAIEYHRRVNWNLDLGDRPISAQELRAILVQAPRQAVQQVIQGEAALLRRLASVAAAPTADRDEYLQISYHLLAHGPISRPVGVANPVRVESTSAVFLRDPKVRAWTLQRADGRCELCRDPSPFKVAEGPPYLESHHITPLVEGGDDTPRNTAALCPNCHRELHFGEHRASKGALLRDLVAAKE